MLLTGSLAASPNLMDVIFSKWAADLNLPSEAEGPREGDGERVYLKDQGPKDVRDVGCSRLTSKRFILIRLTSYDVTTSLSQKSRRDMNIFKPNTE